jgi:hypothetical protein
LSAKGVFCSIKNLRAWRERRQITRRSIMDELLLEEMLVSKTFADDTLTGKRILKDYFALTYPTPNWGCHSHF